MAKTNDPQRTFTFDAVIGPLKGGGITEDGTAACIAFNGMIRDVPGIYEAAVLVPAVPTVVATLIANAAQAQTVLGAQQATTPKPLALDCSAVEIERTSGSALRLQLQLAPGVVLPVDFPREVASALFAALSKELAS